MSDDVPWEIWSAVISLASFMLCAISWLIALQSASLHSSTSMDHFMAGFSPSGGSLSPRGYSVHVIAMGVCGSLFIYNVIKYLQRRNSDGEVTTVALITNRNYNEKNCHRCNCQTRSCRSCVGSDRSSPEWIHLKLLERCRRFESAKKLMALKKGPDEYDNDIENDSGYNGPCISPVCSTDTVISQKKTDVGNGQISYYNGNEIDPSVLYLHEHIEAIVEQLIEDSLEDVTLEPLVQNPEYERMIEIYHRRISDSLSQLIKSIQQSQANMELAIDQTPTSAHSTLKYVINELIEESKELPYLVNRISHSSMPSSSYFVKDEDFEEQSYEDIVSTAIINRVIEKYQKENHSRRFGEAQNDTDDGCSVISSVSHKEIQTDIDLIPVPAPRNVKSNQLNDSLSGDDCEVPVIEDFSWAKDIAKRLPKVEYMIEEQIEEIVTTVKDLGFNYNDPHRKVPIDEPLIEKKIVGQVYSAPDLTSYGAGFDFAQSHKVSFPEFGVDILENAIVTDGNHISSSDETLFMAIIEKWERNWLFRKKKSISPFRNMGDVIIGEEPIAMLVPNPQEGVKVMIGNRDIDELSEMSEKCLDDVDLEDISLSDKSEDDTADMNVDKINIEPTIEECEDIGDFSDGISKDENLNDNIDFSLDECTVDLVYKSVVPILSVSAPSEESLASSIEDLSLSLFENDSTSVEKKEKLNKSLIKQPISFELRPWEASRGARNGHNSLLQQKVRESYEESVAPYTVSRPSFLPGTIAEREHKKWENAVHMPNNPYTAENIARRAFDRSTSFSGRSNSGSWSYSPDETINVVEEVTKINLGPKEDQLLKYKRDYFVNGSSSSGVNRAESCPGERPRRFIGSSKTNTSISTSLNTSRNSVNTSHRISLPDMGNLRLGEFLEDKVANAISLVDHSENEISAIKETIEKVKKDFKNRRTNLIVVSNQNPNGVEKVIAPIPSPRASKKLESTSNGQPSEEMSQSTDNRDTVNTPEKPSVTRVHSITGRYLSKEFRAPAGTPNISKHANQNFSVCHEVSENLGMVDKTIDKSFGYKDLNGASTECQCDDKRKADKRVNRCPWVDQSDCNCNFVIANNARRKKQISSTIASRAEFWDRRVRENHTALSGGKGKRSVDYHGSRLLEAVRGELGENAVRSIVGKRKNSDSTNEKGEFKMDDKKSLIVDFIAKKADILFKPYKSFEVVASSATELEDKDKYAIVPPVECFMSVSSEARKKHFYNCLSKGDVVIGRVSGKHIHGLIITLICMNAGNMRMIDDLNIKCFCHLNHIPQVSAHEDPLNEFNVNDLVQGVVNEISVEAEKIYITMIETTFLHVTQLHLKLGLITEDDLPLHYRKSSKFAGETYESALNRTLGFMNPSIVPQLCLKLGVNVKHWPSLMRGLHEKEYPKSDYAAELYKTQCAQWAYNSVKQGVDHFKAGNKVEAFQCLNKALQIDPLNVEAFVARGALYANHNALSRALEDFEKALEIDSNHVNARKFIVTTLIAYGKQLEEEGRIEDAMKNYKKAMTISPSNAEAIQHMKISQKKLAEKEDLRGRSPDNENKGSNVADTSKTKREPTTKERLRQLLSVDRSRHDKDRHRDKKRQKPMSPVELSSSTSDSSDSSSKCSSSSSNSSFNSSDKGRKRKNGNNHGNSKSRFKPDRVKYSERKSVDSDIKRRRASSTSQNPPIGKFSRELNSRPKDSPTHSRRRESIESQSSTSKFTICDTQRRDGSKSAASNISCGNNSRTSRQSLDNLQTESSSADHFEGRFSEVIEKPKNNPAASCSKAPTLNELESFLASLKAAKSAKKSN
ncbi:hypothetical protein CHUAL_002409 [Chamberlinius hualienensis]